MDRSQKLATVIFVAIIVFIFLGFIGNNMGLAVPQKVGEVYPLQSESNLTSGRLRTYTSEEPPVETYNQLYKKLGRPEEASSITKWKEDQTQPILMLYDDYVITIRGIDGGNRSQVEVTNHETAYTRHRSGFVYFWGSNWGPSVRRGSVYRGTGTGKVQSGGIGGLGGK